MRKGDVMFWAAYSATLVVLLLVWVWAWRGGSEAARAWIRWLPTRRLVLGILPSVWVLFGTAVLVPILFGAGVAPLAWLALLVNLSSAGAVIYFSVYGRIPDWLGPRWYREMKRAHALPVDTQSPSALRWLEEPQDEQRGGTAQGE